MNTVRMSGHAFTVSARVRQFAVDLFGRLGPRDQGSHPIDLVVERRTQREVAVTAVVHDLPGGPLTVNGSAQTVYAALRDAARRARARFARRHTRVLRRH